MKTSPTNDLLVEAGEISLQLRRAKVAKKYLITKISSNDDRILNSIIDLKDKIQLLSR